MRTLDTELPPAPPLDIKISGISDEQGQWAADSALDILAKKLPPDARQLLSGTQVLVGSGLIESGGQTNAEERTITLDSEKNKMSLQAAEDFLVSQGVLNKDDWTRALPETKDKDWSCLIYQLVHEVGHLIDGLSDGEAYHRLATQFSPTKYGTTSDSESFAEAFTYWVFDLEQSPEASQVVLATIF